MKITLPIYYTQEFKTKPNKNILVGMNWYRNAHHNVSNKVKSYYHGLVKRLVGNSKFTTISPQYTIYVSRKNTDGHNIRAVIEKFFLDGLVECGAIKDDSIDFVLGDSSVYLQDKDNPRIEITIEDCTQSEEVTK
jgi:hypothetical protein